VLNPVRQRTAPKGFTLLELIVVTLVILLMIGVAAPMFSKLVKTSRVQQTVNTVMTSLWHARSEAMRYRSNVAVLYGPDRFKCNPPPLDIPTRQLPAKGKIEIWTVKAGDSDSLGAGWGCYSPGFNPTPDWYPFSFPERDLTPQDFTYPDGVRIVCGRVATWWNSSTDNGTLFENKAFKKDSIGQWKRYTSVYSRTGGHVSYDLSNAYDHVMVFDEASGDYALVKVGEWKASTRPRIITAKLKKVCGKTLQTYRDIPVAIDAWAGDR
jgi:prepilin-type N-terminal cleavage/methylation domain-containing protein